MIYEIMYIIPGKFSESEVPGIMEQVEGLFKKHEAEVKKSQNLGKIKLAYVMKKVTHGTYILAYVEAEADAVKKIDNELRLEDSVLRHIIVKRPEGIPEYDIVLTQYQAPITSTGKRVKQQPGTGIVIEEEVLSDDSDSVSADDLNEKLDEMLEDDTVDSE